ncbi:DUF4160 domain-containing protein [Parasphingopyxis algicola]|uniref:DUF4160 domain-containing protein n=1 Tax=Parasphingopyxis algicola TaxID=2026624 RepID=UPI0015A01F53|nr:DUF4160 domain-containing protein [Parasphingopyxis algicola]QLC25733.1 DUF4160 domain-containing protein [Parasphingopyxis algicola]
MPTVLRQSGYRLYFYSHEPNEPPHVHADKGGASAKVWLDDPAIARNFGFNARELAALFDIVRDNRESLLKAWHGYFGSQDG